MTPLCSLQITIDQVIHRIKKLKTDGAVGPDGLSARMLKLCMYQVAPILTKLFNLSLSSGHLPSGWKQANIVPVYKKGDRSNVANYRPIALTSIVCKMLESIVADNLRVHLGNNNLLSLSQHGFKPGLSCCTLLLDKTNELLELMDSKSTQVDLISLDYSKAFDCISHNILISKLEKTYGIRGQLLAWISSFVLGRVQRVTFRGQSADWVSVLSGIPQGSVLGPLLFTIYANDLGQHLTSGIGQFADDTFLYRAIYNANDVRDLQMDLDKLSVWSSRNSLQLNPTKCKFISITRKRTSYPSVYSINNINLDQVNNLPLLGVIISDKLNWDAHVKDVIARSNKLLGFIRHVAGESPPEVLLQLYRTMVLPILDYCSPVWMPHTKRLKNALERVQRTATRAILHQKRREEEYNVRLERLDLSYLSQRREYMSISLVSKCLLNVDCCNAMPALNKIRPNSRHPDHLIFHHLKAKTDAFLYHSIQRFPKKWSDLPRHITDIYLCNSFNCFKSHLRDHFQSIQEI